MTSITKEGRRAYKDNKGPALTDSPLTTEASSFLNELYNPCIGERLIVHTDQQFNSLALIAKQLAARGATNNPSSLREENIFIGVLTRHFEQVVNNHTKWGKWALQLLHDLSHPLADLPQASLGKSHFNNNIRNYLEKVILLCLQVHPTLPDFSAEGIFKSPRPGPHVALDLIECDLNAQAGSIGSADELHWLPEALLLQLPEIFIPALLLNHLNTPIPKILLETPLTTQNQFSVLDSSISLSGLKFYKTKGKKYNELLHKYLVKATRTYLEACSLEDSSTAKITDWHKNMFSRLLQLLISGSISFQDFFRVLSSCEPAQLFRVISLEYHTTFSAVQSEESSEGREILDLWLQFLSFLSSTLASSTSFVDLLWLLDEWLAVFFEQEFNKNENLKPVPEILINAMMHLRVLLQETVKAVFINDFLNYEAPIQDWMARLKFNQRCLYREHARGSCATPVKALGDCLLRLLHSKKSATMDRELYSSHCDSLYTALECLLMNIPTKEELQNHMAYLMTGFKLESNSYNTPIGDYLNRLFQFYLKSLGGNETNLIGFLKTADSDGLPSLLNSIIVLARLKTIVLTSQSEVFRAIIGLAKDNFENKRAVLALVELCLMYLDENSKPPITTLPSIYYKMSDFGFKALFFAFQERYRFSTETDFIIGIAKKLLCRLLSLQDPFVFIKQLFSFVIPTQPSPKQAPAPVDQRKSMSSLINENKIHYFFSDFNKPIFEPLPAQTTPNSSKSNSFPLNILEALGSNKAVDAVKCNIIDLMDLCLTLSQIEPDSTFLIAGAIGLTFDIYGESVVELSTLPEFKVADFQPKRDVMVLARFKEHPILMDMLALISSEPTAFKKAQVVWASLFRSLMHFWTRKFSNKPSEFPKELFLVKRLVHILGLAKWLPPPYHYVSELFEFINSHEVGEILLFSIWPLLRKVKTPVNPRVISGPTPTIGASISLSNSLNLDYVPPELDIIIRALKAHTSETLHLFPLIYART